LYLTAIKESLHIDYDALLKEAEEIQSVETLEPDDLKLKGRKGTENHRRRRKATKLTPEEVPVTVEELNEYV
jgi:hypothetical protein